MVRIGDREAMVEEVVVAQYWGTQDAEDVWCGGRRDGAAQTHHPRAMRDFTSPSLQGCHLSSTYPNTHPGSEPHSSVIRHLDIPLE